MKKTIYFIIAMLASQPALADLVRSKYGFSFIVPKNFQATQVQIPSSSPMKIIDLQSFINNSTFEQILLISMSMSSSEILSAIKELKEWPGPGLAFANGMGNSLARETKQAHGIDCSYKGTPISKKNDSDYSVQIQISCKANGQSFVGFFFAGTFLTRDGQHIIRMQCAVNTGDSCKNDFMTIWEGVNVEPSHKFKF